MSMRDALGESFESLRVRNFRLYFLGQFISQIGRWLTTIGQTLLVLELTDSGIAVGTLMACQFGPVLLFGAWGGLVADRRDKRKLLIVVQAVAIVETGVLAAVAFLPHPPLVAIYGLAIAGGFCQAVDNPARRALIPELVSEESIANAVSLSIAMMTLARIVGPTLAGVLIQTIDYGWCFVLDGVSYLAVIVAIIRMDPGRMRRPPVSVRGRGQIRDGLRYLATEPTLWVPLVMTAVIGAFTFNYQVVLPLFIERTLHGDAGTFTLLFSTLSVGSLGAALVATRRRRVIDLRTVAGSAIAFGLAMGVLAVVPNLGSAFPAAVVVGFMSTAFVTLSNTIVQLQADASMRGRVLAIQAMVFLGATPVGGPILGAICDIAGPRTGMFVGATAAVGIGTWGLGAARRAPSRHRVTPVVPEPELSVAP